MNTFPGFDEILPFLDQYMHELVDAYHAGGIRSWSELDGKVKTFFTPGCMDRMESLAPGWKKMASYSDGVTLTHVICVFLGLYMLPEFQELSDEQKQLAKWIVLFHDVEKIHVRGQRDYTHGFRSAALTASALHALGFPSADGFDALYPSWSEYTRSAIALDGTSGEQIQDNTRLPAILSGIESMFGVDTPAALIVKGVLFHMSVNVVKDWPQAAPLSRRRSPGISAIRWRPCLK